MSVESKIEELASRFQETHRIPDPYRFLIDADGDLFSPSHGCKVISTINTDDSVGQLEKKAFMVISDWVRQEQQGAIIWVSPPYPGRYPVSKLIISEIEHVEESRRLFNRAIVLDINRDACLNLGRKLARFSKNQPFFVGSEDLRAAPIVLDTTKFSWISILENALVDHQQIEVIKAGWDLISKKAAIDEAKEILSMDADRRSMMITKRLGDKPESCPPRLLSTSGQTAFQIFAENALIIAGSQSKDPDFCRSCPVCGEEINCIVRPGQSCPKCRTVKRCG